MRRRLLLAASLLILLAVVAAANATSATLLVTRGASMGPAFSAGDLAILRPAQTYEVGDVAGYRSQALGRVVLHRIAAIDGDAFTFQGDANSFRDPEAVAEQDVVGEVALRLPKVGSVLLWLSSPFNMLLLAVVLGIAVARSRRPRAAVQLQDELDSERVVEIDDLAFPHELPISDVADLPSLLRLAERHDRPVLHDKERGLLFVLEGTMLFRHRVAAAAQPVARLALVPSAAEPQQTGGRRPSPRGPGWDYDHTGS